MRKPESNNVEVDMVPLIDIISLLLMFLIIVGDSAANASNIQMKLPRASQADSEHKWDTRNQIVIQMVKREGAASYHAVINNKSYFTSAENGISLKEYLDKTVDSNRRLADRTKEKPDQSPVKLRIPEDCPMQDVEKVLSTLASLGLVNVHYAAEPDKSGHHS